MTETLHIVGGGMAGSEAAWQAAEAGVPVVIHEMRPKVETFAHRTGNLAEMVCSNSFRSDDHEQNAVGLLHWEMRHAGGLVMREAAAHRLPAGGALAVDRDPFSQSVTDALRAHPNVSISGEEITALPGDGHWIIATGPLTSDALGRAIAAETGTDALAFFDAIAPIVYAESIDMDVAWLQSRYDKGETEEERRARHLDRVLTGRVEQKEMHLFALHGPLIARWKGYARSCRRDSWRRKQAGPRRASDQRAAHYRVCWGCHRPSAWVSGPLPADDSSLCFRSQRHAGHWEAVLATAGASGPVNRGLLWARVSRSTRGHQRATPQPRPAPELKRRPLVFQTGRLTPNTSNRRSLAPRIW